ncbi:Methyltransferase domain-containing protein [Desulfacinum hydrothermale DSM 13146]|uniref:Methyltransferase domain-containing protein n=1 Tax=Desulfacinum hydrothermale DSM 13146 TaxID=1121390 RepID=A0A1W1X8T1_9BACT|nr:class I SAM-dependent methyltransferase [Desulfacinum hydrothermale]SMC20372.1 Methyltransferase domain-containing protein [Desulfacinum hydrothermale DSM 13146]
MNEKKFDPKKLQKLNDPRRLEDIPPGYVWERLNITKADVLVEIGAGTAFFAIAFLKHAKASKIYACDVSEVMINWVKENVVPRFPNIIPVKTEEHSIPLDDAMADLVYMINLHHELDNSTLTLEESYRILKPGGKIFIVDWKKEDMPEGPPTEIRCLPGQVKEELMNSGFNRVNIFGELPKHFLLIGEKTIEPHNKASAADAKNRAAD